MNDPANKKKYYIKIIYDTGDSFHHETDVEGAVSSVEWDDLEKAKAALKAIEEHYEWHLSVEDFGRFYYTQKQTTDLNAEAKKKPWYVEKYSDSQVRVLTDDYKPVEIYAFWTGYFETLKSAEIAINKGKDEMKYVPKDRYA